MKKYKFLRCLAFLLVVVMLIASFPVASLAQTLETTENDNIEETISQPTYENLTETELDETEKDVYILSEDTTKRGEFEKHYLCSDGTFVAVTYAEAVHYRDDNGEWTDIDNSLSANETIGAYEAQNGDYKVSFYTAPVQTPGDTSVAGIQGNTNDTSSSGKLVTMQSKDSALSWTLTANKKLQASSTSSIYSLSENTEQTTIGVSSSTSVSVLGTMKNEEENESFTKININDESAFALPKVSNTVRYDALFGEDEGVSVRYTVYCLSCSSTGRISLAQRQGIVTDDCIWKLELSPIFGSELLSIKNKATNKYLYYDGENLVSDDNPTTEENHRWRVYPLDAEYISILNNTSFSNLNIDIGEPADIDINLPDYFRYASLQDFEYTILSGDDSCVKIMLERGKILGLKAGTVQIQAKHVLLDRTFEFYVTVNEQLYSIQIDQGHTFNMRQIINGVSEWRTDNPDVISQNDITVFECIESGYALVSGYDSDGGLLALVEVRGVTQKDKMLEALTTNETYYLYHHGPCGLNSLASDICSGTSRDFLEVKLVLISSFRLWYNGNLGIEWIKSRIQNYFGLSITTDRAQYVTAEYEVKGLGGYYNPVVQIENLNEFLNNIKALIAMCGFNYAKTLYADDFAANMTTSAQADLQAAYQRRHTVVDVARQSQIANGYSPDNFKTVILKKGDKVYGLLPGPSSWYTTAASVEQSGYNQITLNQGLQIKKSPSLGYRTSVAEYVVKEDIIVAYGTASNNTYVNGEFVGNGGYEQYFIEFFSSVLEYVTETTLVIG